MLSNAELLDVRTRLTKSDKGRQHNGFPHYFLYGWWPPRVRRVLRYDFAWALMAAFAVRGLLVDESAQLGKLDEDERLVAVRKYSDWCRRASRVDWKIDFAGELISSAGFAFMVTSLIVCPIALWDHGALGRAFLAAEFAAMALSILHAAVRTVGTAALDGTLFEKVASPVLLLGVSAVTLLVGGGWTIHVGGLGFGWYEPLGLTVLAGGGILVYLWFVLIMTVTASVNRFVVRHLCRNVREELALFYSALLVSDLVDRSPGERRFPLAGALQWAASCLEALRHDIPVRSAEHRRVVAERFSQAADAVREKALWVALPKADSQGCLRKFVVDLVATVLLGAYDDLPVVAERSGRGGRRRVRSVLTVLRSLVIAAVPMGVLLGLRLVNLRIPDPLGSTATLVAAVWAVVSLLMMIDPAIRERIDVAKNLSSLFSASKTEK